MSADESIVWGKFLSLYGKNYDRFDYDLRVGTGIIPGPEIPENFKQDYISLTQKRIDCVGYTNNNATLFEVKTRALLPPLGQLLGYNILFISTFPNIKVKDLMLICSSITDEDLAIYEQNKIKVFVL